MRLIPQPARALHDYFEERADYWHDVYEGKGFESIHLNERKTMVLSLVDEVGRGKPLHVLDLGCGAGVLTQALLERGHDIVALDASQRMLNSMMRTLSSHPRLASLSIVHSSICDSGLPGASFDLIACVGVIQYQQNEAGIVREISRLLKPGGSCVFTLPNLLCVTHLTDPLYLCRALHRLWSRVLTGRRWHSGKPGLYGVVGGSPDHSKVYNKKYVKWEVKKMLDEQGLFLRDAFAFGFGPLTFWDKELLPERLSISISKRLTSLSQQTLLRWLSYVSNRWVFLATKSD